jgi:hypothetical protein
MFFPIQRKKSAKNMAKNERKIMGDRLDSLSVVLRAKFCPPDSRLTAYCRSLTADP